MSGEGSLNITFFPLVTSTADMVLKTSKIELINIHLKCIKRKGRNRTHLYPEAGKIFHFKNLSSHFKE
jgi:hypothetical protein